MAKEKKKNKILGYILDILTISVLIAIILGVYYIVQVRVLKKDNANLFGYTFFEVATGSMSGTIEIGDIVLVRITKDVQENDIIVYKEDSNYITHRLIEKKDNKLITKGDANNAEDKPITNKQVLGKVEKIVPKVGIWKKVLFSPEVIILGLILVVLLGIIICFKTKTEEKDDW